MKYEVVIGLEIHAELATDSKMFCSCPNISLESEPNKNICPVCTGQPGVLPLPNKKAIEWTIKIGQALGCQIANFSKFDRKNYFYPDLPKGYQISQFDLPFCFDGILEIDKKRIRIRRVHLEEDTGKLTHPKGANYSLVDYNRSGTPLVELVTEPDISSADEARKFCQMYQLILRYLGVSNADMERGEMRCEVNISLKKPEDKEYGNLVEIKNINSFRSVARAIEYEIKRQAEILDSGEKVARENRGWDDNKGATISQREKEEAHEYRYFPEPDIPPIDLTLKSDVNGSIDVKAIKESLPELPQERLAKYKDNYGLSEADSADLIFNKKWSDYFEAVIKLNESTNKKLLANWIINEGIVSVEQENALGLIKMLEEGKISGKIAKDILSKMIETGKTAQELVQENSFSHIKDESAIELIADKIIKENPRSVEDYKSGKLVALKFLVGAVMRETKGQADPIITNKILENKLKKG